MAGGVRRPRGVPGYHPRFAGHLPAGRSRLREVLAPHDLVLVVGTGAFRQYPYEPGPRAADHVLSRPTTPETAAVANIVRAEQLIRRLQDLGHAIGLDDFGRGLSSLTYLKSLSVSDLKIDGALIRDLGVNARSKTLVRAIVQFAQKMKLHTTAACVESEAILSAVGGLGVDYGQGFAIGRPRPLEKVLQELLKGAPGIVRNSGSPRMARVSV